MGPSRTTALVLLLGTACFSSAPEGFAPSENNAFKAVWKTTRVVKLPASFPETGFRGGVLTPADAQEYLCRPGIHACEPGALYQIAGKVEISPAIGAVAYEGMGEGKPMVLVTYAADGTPRAGRLVGGHDGRFGHSATLSADHSLEVSRFLGSGGDKEYLKGETWRIQATGEFIR